MSSADAINMLSLIGQITATLVGLFGVLVIFYFQIERQHIDNILSDCRLSIVKMLGPEKRHIDFVNFLEEINSLNAELKDSERHKDHFQVLTNSATRISNLINKLNIIRSMFRWYLLISASIIAIIIVCMHNVNSLLVNATQLTLCGVGAIMIIFIFIFVLTKVCLRLEA